MRKPGSTFEGGVYRNNYSSESHGLVSALKAFWGARGQFAGQKPVRFTKADNDPAFLKANRSEATLTWVGHATFLVQVAGLNVLTDPVFSRRVSPFPFAGPERLAPLGLTLEQLPAIDLVLISHNHYDHLDEAAVKWLARTNAGVTFVVPLGLKTWFAARGITRVLELDWWQSGEMGAAKVTALPAQHFSGRSPFDRNATLWCSLLLEIGGKKIYFAGDTGYSKDFADIGAAHPGIDLALLPIGAYEPNWFMQSVHVNPEEAVQMFKDLGARHAVAMHWGTFRLTLEALDEPPQRLTKALDVAGIDQQRFFVMQHGETRGIAALL
ncbi:MAG: MBL fold metallo-hydrolase [Stagnimonas sp.]|nr:MBL fold metallo-hydrolase [Stagnimonas sp.]